jgi:hypothetical protein
MIDELLKIPALVAFAWKLAATAAIIAAVIIGRCKYAR